MNLVQKLPIGLSLACLFAMSSCSKEGMQAPEPDVINERAESSMKGALILLPYFAPTISHTGYDYYPKDWERTSYPTSPSVAALPTGVSNLTHAFGKSGLANAWIKPLPAIPSVPGANSIVTITTKTSDWSVDKRSVVSTTIKNLQVGQKYSIEFYVATTSVTSPIPGQGYAKTVAAHIGYPNNYKYIDLAGKKAEWVKENLVFTAWATETKFDFGAISEGDTFAYAHIYVDKNSIKKLP